jgi:nucleotide-binding universal stress UspA family protein
MKKYKRILIRTDVSAPARKAVRVGLGIAKAMRVEAVGVYVRRSFTHVVSAEFDTAAEIERIREDARKEGDKALAAFERAARKARARFSTERAKGDRAWQTVLDAARSLKCDLIVTAADSETGNLLADAKVPVLVVAG